MRYWILTLPLAAVLGCGSVAPAPNEATSAPRQEAAHDHKEHGPHGGPLAEWGDHEYHAEFTVDHAERRATVYVFDREVKAPRPVAAERLTVTLKLTPPVALTLLPAPQPGDPAGSASVFTGADEALGRKRSLAGTISAQIGTKRYSGDFREAAHSNHAEGPSAPSALEPTQREKDLFLKPGGIYTSTDIAKNGNTVPSVKYRGLEFAHDDDLRPGDKLCPVTVNKADDKCQWWVNGKEYQFCCPPCLEKFVKQAKETPERIKEPEAYVHQ